MPAIIQLSKTCDIWYIICARIKLKKTYQAHPMKCWSKLAKVETFITGKLAKRYSTYVYPTLLNLPRYGTLWVIMSVKKAILEKKMYCRETWWDLPIPRYNIRKSCIKSVSDKLGWNMLLGGKTSRVFSSALDGWMGGRVGTFHDICAAQEFLFLGS